MFKKTNNTIGIHPVGTRVTDNNKVKELQEHTPTAIKYAHFVLTNADKYINKKGFLVSDRKRIQRLQKSIYELRDALENDNFLVREMNEKGHSWSVIEYLSHISNAYPNWQKEYKALNSFIPRCF
jgi:hypothetical protein